MAPRPAAVKLLPAAAGAAVEEPGSRAADPTWLLAPAPAAGCPASVCAAAGEGGPAEGVLAARAASSRRWNCSTDLQRRQRGQQPSLAAAALSTVDLAARPGQRRCII